MSQVKCNVGEKTYKMNPDNTEIFIFPSPYEEMSCLSHSSQGDSIIMWDNTLMDLLAKAGVTVNYHDSEPPAELIDQYVKDQIREVDTEWTNMTSTS